MKNIESKNNNIWLLVGVMVVVGLAAGVIGASITGNFILVKDTSGQSRYVYSAAEANRTFATKAQVIDMLKSCITDGENVIGSTTYGEIIVGSSSLDTCEKICNYENGRKCIWGFIAEESPLVSQGHVLNYNINCDTSFNYINLPSIRGLRVSCNCCEI